MQKNNNNVFKNVLTNSAEHGIISQRDFFERNIANKNNISTYYIVQNDDFVYNPRISNSSPYGPINRNKTGYTGIISPLYYVFRVLGINTAFIEWYFKTTCWHKFMYQHGDSGARSDRFSIKDNELKKLPIKLPADDTEQEKIAKTLNSLNNTIQLHERKCEELTLIKKALLQKLFPKKDKDRPEVRYKNFSDAWEQRKLGEVVKKSTIKNSDLEYSKDDILSVATMSDMNFSREINSTKDYMKTYNKILYGEIAFEGHSSKNYKFGRFVLNDYRNGIVSHIYDIYKITINYDMKFMKEWISLDKVMYKPLVNSTTNARMMNSLQAKNLYKQKVLLPNLQEQKEIGKFLKKVDSLIALHQRKLEKLKQLKKFLLQNMGSLSKRTDAKILIIIFKLLDESLIVFCFK
ncbi:MAG: restriction endonuclease subunit S [Ligilactobacillus salivarius]|nr:restriction endonuclease subunit S [Ligilactobacillus salivarius]